MAQFQATSGYRKQTRIDVHEVSELRDWASKLGVTPQDLKAAVDAVGSNGEAVAQHLRSWYTTQHTRLGGVAVRRSTQGLKFTWH